MKVTLADSGDILLSLGSWCGSILGISIQKPGLAWFGCGTAISMTELLSLQLGEGKKSSVIRSAMHTLHGDSRSLLEEEVTTA